VTMQTSKAILARNRVVGHPIIIDSSGPSYVENSIANTFEPKTPKNLIKFMFLLHERRGLRPRRTESSYIREAKRFISEVGEEQTEKLMLEAARVASHSWGFNFLNNLRLNSHGNTNKT